MFSLKMYIVCLALIGGNLILADDNGPQNEDRRRPFRFPWPTITASWNREEGAEAANATAQSQNGDRRIPFFPWWLLNREDASGSQDSSASPSNRGFNFPAIIPCNHTTQGGLSCSSCNQVLYCAPFNVGIQSSCGMGYCNQGRCSTTPSADCGPSDATSA